MPPPHTIKTPAAMDRWMVALAPVDAAFVASERTWGVGRLETLVSASTLASYRRGWVAYRKVLNEGDVVALEALAPKMIRMLGIMGREAEVAGHQPLRVDQWEHVLRDGRLLILVRTAAEAHAVVADKQDKRDRVVWSLDEAARAIEAMEVSNAVKQAFPGAVVQGMPAGAAVRTAGTQRAESGQVLKEGELSDWASGDALSPWLHGHPESVGG